MELKNIYSKKILSIIINKFIKKHLIFLRKYDLLYSLNQYKYNKLVFLPILSKILNKIVGKKIEYNIINLKSITYNTDLFTNALALKLKKRKVNHINSMLSLLNRANLALPGAIYRALEKEQIKNNRIMDIIQNKYEDLRIVSALNANSQESLSINNFDELLDGIYPTKIVETQQTASSRSSDIHRVIYNSIKHKNMVGIRLEIKGRLTKRYRADRSIYALK
ncbi:MAG: hypothetical protein KIT57_24630 [Blastocatellales bacterium]|nr:hypothetical protein [Blastocatellales bacterium]